jgi:endonuclease YncB( thermonuclease family)
VGFSRLNRNLVRYAVLAGLAAGAGVAQAAESSAPCGVTAVASATVAAIVDERTLRLADGHMVQLAGLVSLVDAGDPAAAEVNAARARAELARLAHGKALALEDLGENRYGWRVVLATIATEPAGRTLQEQLIAAGHGLVTTRIERPGCSGHLLAAERRARAARLGLWANPHDLVRDARTHAAIAALRGRFLLVEGAVRSVNDRGATVYINFGRRWSEDFTVTIAKPNMRSFAAAGLDPQMLTGHRVRIRGWVDTRGGPWIEATEPAQIEFADSE